MASGVVHRMVVPLERPKYMQRLESQIGHLEGAARDKTQGEIDELLEFFTRLRKKLED